MSENILTPIKRKKAIAILSKLVSGYMSPNPTVVNEVNAK